MEANTTTFVYSKEDSIPEELICAICCLPFVDPVEHVPSAESGGCSQIYCRKCISSLTKCPHCRNEVKWRNVEQTPLTQRFLFKRLAELEVICPQCNQATPRGEYKSHFCGCPKPCVNGCGTQITPNQQAKHDAECPAKIIPCIGAPFGCKWSATRGYVDEHSAVCPFVALYPILMEYKQRIEALETAVLPSKPYPNIPQDNQIMPLQFRGINGYADQLDKALFCWRWFPRGSDKFRVITLEDSPDALQNVESQIRPRDLAGVHDYRDAICDTFFCWRWLDRNGTAFRVVTIEHAGGNSHHDGASSILPRHLKGTNGYQSDEIAHLRFSWRQFTKNNNQAYKVLTIE